MTFIRAPCCCLDLLYSEMFPWIVKSSKLEFLESSCVDDLSSRKSGRRRGGQTLGFFDDSSKRSFGHHLNRLLLCYLYYSGLQKMRACVHLKTPPPPHQIKEQKSKVDASQGARGGAPRCSYVLLLTPDTATSYMLFLLPFSRPTPEECQWAVNVLSEIQQSTGSGT
jgi:hypothetical protein